MTTPLPLVPPAVAAVVVLVVALGHRALLALDRPVRVPPVVRWAGGGAAALGAAAVAAGAPGPGVATGLGLLGGWCVLLAGADLAARRLPDVLTLPGAGVALLLTAGAGRGWAALLGALALAGPHLVVHLLAPRALGAGDGKLALGLGAAAGACGPDAWLLAAVGAPLLTGLAGVALVGLRRCSRSAALPHGPGMCLATCLVVVAAVT